jgi:hypothetical protein
MIMNRKTMRSEQILIKRVSVPQLQDGLVIKREKEKTRLRDIDA